MLGDALGDLLGLEDVDTLGDWLGMMFEAWRLVWVSFLDGDTLGEELGEAVGTL